MIGFVRLSVLCPRALCLLPEHGGGGRWKIYPILCSQRLSGSSLGTACGFAAKAECKEQDVSALGVFRQVPNPKFCVSVAGTLFLLIDLLLSSTGQRAH